MEITREIYQQNTNNQIKHVKESIFEKKNLKQQLNLKEESPKLNKVNEN